jgi:hypothetical protein
MHGEFARRRCRGRLQYQARESNFFQPVEKTIMARLTSITKKEQVPAEYHGVFDAVTKSRGGVHGPFSMAMHCPPIAAHLVTLGGYVRFEGKLDHR